VGWPCDDPRVISPRRIGLATLLAALTLFASCGGGDGTNEDGAQPPGHEAVGVIEGWVETLAQGDVGGAADYFAVPSVVQNATAPITLRSRADVVAFNRSLPCGARLVKAQPLDHVIVATFRLTERPGGNCGSGAGLLARTGFVIRRGKIVEWRRLPNPRQQGPGNGPIV
jgi:hypothetical protein